MSLHDDARFQEIYQDALRALEYLPHLESYPTERARIAERFTSEFLARHPECKPAPVDLQSGDSNASEVLTEISGEQVNLADIITESLDAYLVHGNSEDATFSQAVIRGHYLATALAGYRNRPMPSVDEVARVIDQLADWRSEYGDPVADEVAGMRDASRMLRGDVDSLPSWRWGEAKTAVLALFTKESE